MSLTTIQDCFLASRQLDIQGLNSKFLLFIWMLNFTRLGVVLYFIHSKSNLCFLNVFCRGAADHIHSTRLVRQKEVARTKSLAFNDLTPKDIADQLTHIDCRSLKKIPVCSQYCIFWCAFAYIEILVCLRCHRDLSYNICQKR